MAKGGKLKLDGAVLTQKDYDEHIYQYFQGQKGV